MSIAVFVVITICYLFGLVFAFKAGEAHGKIQERDRRAKELRDITINMDEVDKIVEEAREVIIKDAGVGETLDRDS